MTFITKNQIYECVRGFAQSKYVFVYGTLKSGNYNNYHLEDSIFIGEYKTKKEFDLRSSVPKFGFPFLVDGDKSVIGEIYELVDVQDLLMLDLLEGHPYGYTRQLTDVPDFENLVWIYKWNGKYNPKHMGNIHYKDDSVYWKDSLHRENNT